MVAAAPLSRAAYFTHLSPQLRTTPPGSDTVPPAVSGRRPARTAGRQNRRGKSARRGSTTTWKALITAPFGAVAMDASTSWSVRPHASDVARHGPSAPVEARSIAMVMLMPTQAELIGLLHQADTAWTSVRGVARHWRDQDLVNIAFTRHVRAPREAGPIAAATLVASREGDDDPMRESVFAIATDRHGRRRRAEAISRRNEHVWADVLVIDGHTFWARTGTSTLTNDGDPNVTHGGAGIIDLLLPSAVPAGFELTPDGDLEVVAGRTCAVARAAPRGNPDLPMLGSEVFNMIAGGDDFRLSVDLDTGVLLQVIKFVDGAAAELCEFTEITFDETLDDDLFAPLL